MANRDIEQVALLAELQRTSGGNSAEILDTVVGTIRERAEIRRLVGTLTAQGRMARWILTALPIFLTGVPLAGPPGRDGELLQRAAAGRSRSCSPRPDGRCGLGRHPENRRHRRLGALHMTLILHHRSLARRRLRRARPAVVRARERGPAADARPDRGLRLPLVGAGRGRPADVRSALEELATATGERRSRASTGLRAAEKGMRELLNSAGMYQTSVASFVGTRILAVVVGPGAAAPALARGRPRRAVVLRLLS